MVIQELIDLNQGVIDACEVNAGILADLVTAEADYETAHGNLTNAIQAGNGIGIQTAWDAFEVARDARSALLSQYFESQKAVGQNCTDAFQHLLQ